MVETDHNKVVDIPFLQGGGEMGNLTRCYDWSSHSLGAPQNWPQSLKTTLSIILNSRFPMFLWWGPDHICFYNDAYRPSLGDAGKHPSILGAPAIEAWPEIWDYIKPLMDQILAGGEATYNEDLLVPIYRNGRLEDVYWTFSYSPVIDESGIPAGVFVTCTETTQKVNLVNHLIVSEQRFQNLVRDASVGIIVLIGENLRVEIVNEAYGSLIERTPAELLNRNLFDIIPEAEAYYRPLINRVMLTGKSMYLYNQTYNVSKNGKKISGYIDIIYQPYREVDGSITGIIALCQDISEQVEARSGVERALEQLRLSKEAAQLGTFDMNLDEGTMEWDERCRTLFGISHDNQVNYETDFVGGLHPDDRDRIVGVINELFTNPEKKGNYDVEYRTIGFEDQRERWVRAKGKVYFLENKPVRFIGSVLDITEAKRDEIRKNDFIAMVSHELKTPLTSLTAIIQMLLAKNKDGKGDFQTNALMTANKQAKKMSTMINGFLNTSRLESGKLIIQKTKFDIIDLLEEIVEEMKLTYPGYNIEFLNCEPVVVYGDHEKIGSVVSNLVSNAVKYSPVSKEIRVSCEILKNEVKVSVKDKGIGIKPYDLEKLFDRYYRVENENTSHISGFGIGLYLSAEIIERHNGKIWAESKPNEGSTFSFSLPI